MFDQIGTGADRRVINDLLIEVLAPGLAPRENLQAGHGGVNRERPLAGPTAPPPPPTAPPSRLPSHRPSRPLHAIPHVPDLAAVFAGCGMCHGATAGGVSTPDAHRVHHGGPDARRLL